MVRATEKKPHPERASARSRRTHHGRATDLRDRAALAIPRPRMLTVLGILLPVFGLIAIGYGMARTPLLRNEGVRGLGSFVYYVALPALLFRSTATPPSGESGSGAIIAAFFGG